MVTAHVEISGKVQGVFFRATAKKIAEKNNLNGWIRNKNDGNVEAVVTGNNTDVEKFIEWSKHGPEKAVVSTVHVTYLDEMVFKEFKVKREW